MRASAVLPQLWRSSKPPTSAGIEVTAIIGKDCPVGCACTIGEECVIPQGCVLGDEVVIERGSELSGGVKVWPAGYPEPGTPPF